MGFLTPLYIAGVAAVSVPILLHLIRRTPRGRYLVGSLMFLRPSPPRLTRRSRLDHFLLLLLRAAVLTLLALAFARPYWRAGIDVVPESLPGRRVAVLVDVSASMRRGELWSRAQREVEAIAAEAAPDDQLALFSFSDEVEALVGFDDHPPPAAQPASAMVKSRMEAMKPTWGGTNLGAALVEAADRLTSVDIESSRGSLLQIILVTDLQEGSDIRPLRAYQWPGEVRVSVRRLTPGKQSECNAFARPSLSTGRNDGAPADDRVRIRLGNASNSSRDQFLVGWSAADGARIAGGSTPCYVPPGGTRVVRLAGLPDHIAAGRLVLSGDDCPFDNTFYFVPPQPREVRVVYVGTDPAEDADGLRYYLEAALAQLGPATVRVVGKRPDQPMALEGDAPDLVVVAEPLSPAEIDQLSRYVSGGGSLLMVPKSQEAAAALTAFSDQVVVTGDQQPRAREAYALLGQVDFTHPLMAPFASPRYNDFTEIHFWQHRSVRLDENASTVRVVAWFDNGTPAIWHQPLDRGHLMVLTSGWHPADSQLAMSSKFVPFIGSLLQQAAGDTVPASLHVVNQPIQVPEGKTSDSPTVMVLPDGTRRRLAPGDDHFSGTDTPGVYRLETSGTSRWFAVNLADSESETAPMSVAALQEQGVRMGNHPVAADRLRQRRELRDVQLESRQKMWQWLVVAALGVMAMETWLAGRRARATVAAGQEGDRAHPV